MENILLMTDSYKASHFLQYPPGTRYVSSYIESRGGRWNATVFFGLQMFLMRYLTKPINMEMINEAEAFWKAHGEPFNREGWEYILAKHGGFLPIKIDALPEGTVIKNHNALVQVVNTDPEVPWLTCFIETALLRAVWYPTTVATNSFAAKQVIYKYLKETADDADAEIGFKMHDFGARGVSSAESAAIGGAAHLVNFLGTDTVEGVMAARKYYGADMAGFSIPAAEHSTITAWGGQEQEVNAFRNMLKQFAKPGTAVAVVSDSYNIYQACKTWATTLKQEVIDSGATVVVRPDSGDPVTVPIECIEILMEHAGYTINSKGYKVLPSYFRVIQGDGIDAETIAIILEKMKQLGLSASNIAFGQGGALLQKVDRDTLKFAMKASAINIHGVWRPIYKNPVTDYTKVSKRGRQAVIDDGNGELITIQEEFLNGRQNHLTSVFCDGIMLRTTNFEKVRERAQAGINLPA